MGRVEQDKDKESEDARVPSQKVVFKSSNKNNSLALDANKNIYQKQPLRNALLSRVLEKGGIALRWSEPHPLLMLKLPVSRKAGEDDARADSTGLGHGLASSARGVVTGAFLRL